MYQSSSRLRLEEFLGVLRKLGCSYKNEAAALGQRNTMCRVLHKAQPLVLCMKSSEQESLMVVVHETFKTHQLGSIVGQIAQQSAPSK